MDSAIGFIAEWLNSGTYNFFTEAAAYFIEKATIAYLKFVAWAIPFAWGIGKQILLDLNITQTINSAWSNFDSQTLATLNFFRVPEGINYLFTAGATKLALRFIPGF